MGVNLVPDIILSRSGGSRTARPLPLSSRMRGPITMRKPAPSPFSPFRAYKSLPP